MKYFDFLDNEEENSIKMLIENTTGDRLHGILIVNVDNYIIVNELFGRSRGDAVLKEVSRTLSKIFTGTDIILKLRGDEFLIYTSNKDDIANIELIVDELIREISAIKVEADFQLSVNVGLSIYPYHGRKYDELKNKAYQAMLKAKANGKNCYRLYENAYTKLLLAKEMLVDDRLNETDYDDWFGSDFTDSFSNLSNRLLNNKYNIFDVFNSILELGCYYFGFSRGFVSNVGQENPFENPKLRYAKAGYEFGRASARRNVIVNDMIASLRNSYKELRILCLDNEDIDEGIRAIMETEGIYQMLFYPIYVEERFAGAFMLQNLQDDIISLKAENIADIDCAITNIVKYYHENID